jgi:hypothetical protein
MHSTTCCWRCGRHAHAEFGCVLLIHSQRKRSVKPRMCKSGKPSPPCSLGEQTIGQEILHLPPATASVPAQMKARRHLSISYSAQGDM